MFILCFCLLVINMKMNIRNASEKDLQEIMRLFVRARDFMVSQGNPNQWVNNYPSEELMKDQIQRGVCKVCCAADGKVVATFCFIEGPDPTYSYIEGEWLSDKPYSVIHRLASDGSVSGIADCCISWCREHAVSLRLDTHEDNKLMQHVAEKNGFVYCGIIYVANGTPRLAYQLDL